MSTHPAAFLWTAARSSADSLAALEAMVRASPLGTILTDEEGRVHAWNPAAHTIFGWTAEEVLGHFVPAVPAERRPEFLRDMRRVMKEGGLANVVTRRRTKSGRTIEVELWAAPVELEGRRFCLCLLADVTATRGLARRQAIQLELGRLLAEEGELSSVVRAALQKVCGELGWHLGQLWLLDAAGEALTCAGGFSASAGGEDVFVRQSRALRFSKGEGLPGRAWAVGHAYLVQALAEDKGFARAEAAAQLGLVSGVACPVKVGNQLLGVLEFFHREPMASDETFLAFLESVASPLGQFIARHRMEEERQQALHAAKAAAAETAQRNAELTLLYGVSSILSASLDVRQSMTALTDLLVPAVADICSLFVLQGAQLVRVGQAAISHEAAEEMRRRQGETLSTDSSHPVAQVLRSGKALLFPDFQQEVREHSAMDAGYRESIARLAVKTALAVPLSARGRVLGVLTLGRVEGSQKQLGQADVALTEELAQRAAVALDNVRLYQASEEARRQAETMSARALAADRRKDEFLAMLGHELRNPLAPIQTALEVMRLRAGPEVLAQERALIERSVSHMVRLVDDLLDVARITRGKIELRKERMELSAAISRALELVSPLLEQKAHHLTVDVPRQGLRVRADPQRLAQVLAHLLTNAARYTDAGGSISLRAHRSGDKVELRIRDNGRGITPELLPHVFEMFVQSERSLDRTEGGLGIGLTLVKSLVELQGGAVTAKSEGPGRGAEFTVVFPLDQALDAVADVSASEGPQSAPRRRVLVVDDNVDACDALAEGLELLGHTVRAVYGPLEALDQAPLFQPDVVICDIGLPVMSGYQLARRLQESNPSGSLALLALSGYGQENDRQRSKEAGFELHLVKPVDLERLQVAIEKGMELAERRRQGRQAS